ASSMVPRWNAKHRKYRLCSHLVQLSDVRIYPAVTGIPCGSVQASAAAAEPGPRPAAGHGPPEGQPAAVVGCGDTIGYRGMGRRWHSSHTTNGPPIPAPPGLTVTTPIVTC